VSESLVETVRDAGIIGCGGAGFPTHVKIDTRADVVLANGAECEPLLNSDQRVMEHAAADIVEGLSLVMDHVGAAKGYLAVKEEYSGAVAALSAAAEGRVDIEVALLGSYYPSGDEHILLSDVTGKIVPEGGIPLNVGAVVSNVLTFAQIARATRGENVTERAVTLVGEVRKPQVAVVPIGTLVGELLELAVPALGVGDIAVIDGGPMMGRRVALDDAVCKTTSGLLFLPKDHPVIALRDITLASILRRGVAACCQCRMCTEVCSRYMQGHAIEPHLMMRGLAYGMERPTAAMTGAFLCSQCGLCEFACPMQLSPRRAFVELLARFRRGGMKNPHNKAPVQLHEFNRYRKISKKRLVHRYELAPYESHGLPLSRIGVPGTVRLSLSQSAGAPAQPVVGVGAAVRRGELVAQIPEGKLGSNLHASIDGRVVAVDETDIVLEGKA
jgi:Na+-translocating ferredoxin:NAD+ oxidoreductase RnfC subunit